MSTDRPVQSPQSTIPFDSRRNSLASPNPDRETWIPFRRVSDALPLYASPYNRRDSFPSRRRMSSAQPPPDSPRVTTPRVGATPRIASFGEHPRPSQPRLRKFSEISRGSSYASQSSNGSDNGQKDRPPINSKESYKEKVQKLRSRSREIIENTVGTYTFAGETSLLLEE